MTVLERGQVAVDLAVRGGEVGSDVRALPASSAVAAERLADRLVDARLLEYVGTDVDGRHCYRMPNLSRLFAREEVFARKEATATSRGLPPTL